MERLFRLVASLIISLTTLNAFAQPPGVGPAEVLPGYCLFTVVIDTGDYITIANILDVEDNQLVLTYSNKGNANLNCSGKLDRTAPVVGTDLLVNPGAPVVGMLIPQDEACAFVEINRIKLNCILITYNIYWVNNADAYRAITGFIG